MRQKEEGMKVPRILQWEASVPVPPIPDTNYASFVLNVISQYGEDTALVDAATGKCHTYGDICRLVPRVRSGLVSSGVNPGDAVMLLSTNHIDAPISMLAIMLAGATCVPINPLLNPVELSHVATTSEARWVIVQETVVSSVEEAFAKLAPGTLKQLWVIGDISGKPSLSDLARTQSVEIPPKNERFNSAAVVALMPFSSGTTGFPKGVMLSHQNLLTSYFSGKYVRDLIPPGGPNALKSTLMSVPTYHIYGYSILMSCLASGGQAIMLQKFSPEKYLQAIDTYKVTYSPIVPHIAKFLSETPLLQKYDLSSLIAFVSGSAPLPTPTLMALMAKSGKGAGQGYGMTEACAPIAVNGGPMGFKIDAVGKLLPYFECKLVDVTTGIMVNEGEEGEVCLRGPSIMLGYANNPKATAETIDSEGWLHTGDLGYYDADNFIFLTDRIKDLIKVKGYQVTPSELEKLIRSLDGVSDVSVVGVPNDRLGEAPRAFIVPKSGANLDVGEIIKYVADNVSPSYKQLAGGVEIVEVLPKNHLGKILKRQLKSSFLQSKL